MIIIIAFCSFGFFQERKCSERSCVEKWVVSITQTVAAIKVTRAGFIVAKILVKKPEFTCKTV